MNRKDEISIKGIVLKTAIIMSMFAIGACIVASIPENVAGEYGKSKIDGILNPAENYTLLINGSKSQGYPFDLYQENDNGAFYWYFQAYNRIEVNITTNVTTNITTIFNITFENFSYAYKDININVSANSAVYGIYGVVFNVDRTAMEVMLSRSIAKEGDFTFWVNGINYTISIVASEPPEPPEPPLEYEIGLTEIMQFLIDLVFAKSWLSVVFWVLFIIAFWRATKRKIWILRKETSFKGKEYGRWIKEEIESIGGDRFYRHTFKTDAAKTAKVNVVYSDYNKEELVGKCAFQRINGFWYAFPYTKVGKLKLRPDQYFPKQEMSKTPLNYLKRFVYYLCCWIPKLNDELYKSIEYIKTSEIVKEIDFLYLIFPEERVVEVFSVSWYNQDIDIDEVKEVWNPKTGKLTKEEIALLQQQDQSSNPNGTVRLIEVGNNSFEIRKFASLNEAMDNQLAKEELIATYRYKIGELDYIIRRINGRLEKTINVLEDERRKRVEDKQDMLFRLNEYTSLLNQNLPNWIGTAVGLQRIGVSRETALQETLKKAIMEFQQNIMELEDKRENNQQERIDRRLKDIELRLLKMGKKTPQEIIESDLEYTIPQTEHTNKE